MKHTLLALALFAGAAMGQTSSQPDTVTGTPGTGTTPPSATGAPMTTPESPPATESVEHAFRALDKNRRGYLTRDEVQTINGFSFEAADTNKDGRLSPAEFERAWSSQYASSPGKK